MQNDGSVSPIKAFFRNRWIKLILVIDAIVIITIIAIIIFNASRTATIHINVTPVDASIQIGATGGGILMALIKFIPVPTTLPSPTKA